MNEDDLLKDADAKLAQNEIELLGCYDVHPEPYENDPEAADARRAFLDHLLAPFFARIRELEAHTATYRAQVDAVLKDRALIITERDRTFALMLERAEAAEAKLALAVDALQHEVIRSRRHLAQSTLDAIAALTAPDAKAGE